MERSSKRIGITPLDWLLLGGALLALAVTVGYAWYTEREAPPNIEIECVFLIDGVERQWLEQYGMPTERGDGVRSENGTILLGKVISVEERSHLRLTVSEGELIWEEHPYLTDLAVTVRMTVTDVEGDGLRAGDLRMAAGRFGNYRFGSYLAKGEMIGMREVVA